MRSKLNDTQIHNPKAYAGYGNSSDTVIAMRNDPKQTLDQWAAGYKKATGRIAFIRPEDPLNSLVTK